MEVLLHKKNRKTKSTPAYCRHYRQNEHNNRNALPQKYKNTFQGRDMTAYMAGQGEARDKCVHEWSGRVGH